MMHLYKNKVVHAATIIPQGDYLGRVTWINKFDNSFPYRGVDEPMNRIIVDLAGGVAEQVCDENKSLGLESFKRLSGIDGDLEDAELIADDIAKRQCENDGWCATPHQDFNECVKHEYQNRTLQQGYNKTVNFIATHRHDVDKVSQLLREKDVVHRDELYKTIGLQPKLYDFEEPGFGS